MRATKARSIFTVVSAGVVAWSFAPQPAEAQILFWPQFQPSWRSHAPVRHKHYPYRKKSKRIKQAPAEDVAKGPLQLVVSIADQHISVYGDGALIARSPVSTGTPDHPTPLGIFGVISKQRWHRSNIYSNAPMPYMQRLTWSGIALHAGVLPGYPASHGCIRLEKDFAPRLWHLTRRGTRVIIAPHDVQPLEIAHERLPQPASKSVSDQQRNETIAANNKMIEVAGIGPLYTSVDAPPLEQIKIGNSKSARKAVPLSILVSRKSNKIFVRRGTKNVFEAPVTIDDPQTPLGTHLFTFMGERPDDRAFRWTVMSIPDGPHGPQSATRRSKTSIKQSAQTVAPEPSSPEKANVALSRIQMPPDAMERIAELLTPGSSLIVTDYGISKESGPGTDLIVETR